MSRHFHNVIFTVVAFTCMALGSCSNPETKSTTMSNIIDTPTVSWDTTAAFYIDSQAEETIDFLPAVYADNGSNITTQYGSYILLPFSYHGDEVPHQMLKASWHTLYKKGNTFFISKEAPSFKYEFDAIVDEGTSDKTGVAVHSSYTDAMFIGNVSNLKTGELTHITLDTNIIMPGTSHYFKYKGADYRIYASAYKYQEQNEGQFSIRNYRVYLERQKDSVTTKQLIVARPYIDHIYYLCMVSFVGDIDGDDIPDFILNVPMENGNNTILYLSSEAGESELLKTAAVQASVGC